MKNATPTVLIFYPNDFSCYKFFERKARNILSSLNDFEVAYINDEKGYIERLFNIKAKTIASDTLDLSSLRSEHISYAIIFDDKDSTNEIITTVEDMNIPTRIVDANITRVVNKDKNEKYDVYIGRGSIWGNPYAIGHDGDREEVIRKFKYDFERNLLGGDDFNRKLLTLKGKKLGCHCKPLACHGDVYADFLNSYDCE